MTDEHPDKSGPLASGGEADVLATAVPLFGTTMRHQKYFRILQALGNLPFSVEAI